MSGLSQANAHLVGLWLQLIATGVYFVYCPQCVVIMRRKIREGLSLWFPAVCVLIFLVTVIDLVTELIRTYQAFGVLHGTRPDPSAYFANPSSPESLVKNSITTSLAMLSDIIMVYRTFTVWGHNVLIILIPAGLLMSGIALGCWSIWTLAQTTAGDALVFAEVSIRVRYFYIDTFCLNVVCASLICWRIWRVNSTMGKLRDWSTTRVMEVIIETAAFYCCHLCILWVTLCIGTNIFFAFLDPLPPVTALVFTLLIVRTRSSETCTDSTVMELSTTFRFQNTCTPPPESTHVQHDPDLDHGTLTDERPVRLRQSAESGLRSLETKEASSMV